MVVEEILEGPEVSAFALSDGEAVVPLVLSQDFKRAGDGDTGPNTGGMGAYSPLPWIDDATEGEIWDLCRRTVATMATEGLTYRGLLYTGLMLTSDGPKVLEYNCRFGDPETEVVIPRLRTDLADLLLASAAGGLARREGGLDARRGGHRDPRLGRLSGRLRDRRADRRSRRRRRGRGRRRVPCGHRRGRR